MPDQTQTGTSNLAMQQVHRMFHAGSERNSVGVFGPLSQLSTNATLPVIDSNVYTGGGRRISFTIAVATNAVTWSVWGANSPTFSDEVAVLSPASVAAGAFSSFAGVAFFLHYRVKIVSTAGGAHGTATVSALLKT